MKRSPHLDGIASDVLGDRASDGVTPDGMTSDGAAREAACAALATALWREREVLDRLLFALVAEQMIVRAGYVRWLAQADAQVLAATECGQELEVLRAIEVQALAAALGVDEELTLAQLADVVPEPWSGIYAEHRDALRELTAEIADATATNRRLLRAGAAAAAEALDRVGQSAATYGSDGAVVPISTGPIALDREA